MAKVKEHKKAVEQAEKIEQEFVSLMTGQKQNGKEQPGAIAHVSRMSRYSSSPAKLFMVLMFAFCMAYDYPLLFGSFRRVVRLNQQALCMRELAKLRHLSL